MSISSQIFEWEGITQPSYWGANHRSRWPGGYESDRCHRRQHRHDHPEFFQTDKFSNSMGLRLGDPNNPWDNESDTFDLVKQSILSAKAHGLKVVLKPHLETSPTRVWGAELAPSDPKAWFASYKAMMVEY